MERINIRKAVKTIGLTIITFGIYGAYWIMKTLYDAPDIKEDELEKDADFTQRAVASAFLSRHDLH